MFFFELFFLNTYILIFPKLPLSLEDEQSLSFWTGLNGQIWVLL